MTSAIPVDMTEILNASNVASFSTYGFPVTDGQEIDLTTSGLAQTTPANRPNYMRRNVAGGSGVVFGGAGEPLYNTPTSFTAPSQKFQTPFSMTCIMRGDSVATAFELSPNVTSSQGVLLGTDTAAFSIHGPGGLATFTAAAGWNSSNVGQIITLTCDGTKAGTILLVNNVPVSITASGADPGVGTTTVTGFVGTDHAGASPLTGAIAYLGFIWGRVQTAQETDNIQTALTVNGSKNIPGWYIPPSGLSQTIKMPSVGDSISVGFDTTSTSVGNIPYAYPTRTATIIGSRIGSPASVSAINFGVGGISLGAIQAIWVSSGGPACDPTLINIACLQGGINDIAAINPGTVPQAQTAAATVYPRAVSLVQAAIATLNGFSQKQYAIFHTIPLGKSPSQTAFSAMAAQFFNQLCVKGLPLLSTSNVEVVVEDIGTDDVVSQRVNVNWSPITYGGNAGNAVHPGKPGHDVWSARFAKLILSLGL
jgi:hypothetical protein